MLIYVHYDPPLHVDIQGIIDWFSPLIMTCAKSDEECLRRGSYCLRIAWERLRELGQPTRLDSDPRRLRRKSLDFQFHDFICYLSIDGFRFTTTSIPDY